MPAARPLTKAGELLDSLSVLVSSSSRYLDLASLDVRRWNRDADALMAVSAPEGSLVKSKLCEAVGDIEGVERWAKNAERLGVSWVTLAEHLLVSYANLGYAGKGLQVFRDCVDVSRGNIGATIRLASAVGAFEQMKTLMNKASKAGISLADAEIWPGTDKVAEAVERAHISDDECAKVIDVAGEVMRKHRLFWTGERHDFIVDSEQPSVLMRFSVDVSYADACSMNLEAIDLLIDRNLDASSFKIDFVGARP